MKKISALLFCLVAAVLCAAEDLPDNMYFKAMKKEMDRSLKHLSRPGVPPLFYMAYKLENYVFEQEVAASLGALYAPSRRDPSLTAYVWVDVGTPQQDSMGYAHDAYSSKDAYSPYFRENIAKSYAGIRQALWQLTDASYKFAAETYQQKQAYLSKKNEINQQAPLPDFVPQPQSQYVAPIEPLPAYDKKTVQAWVKQLSALGKEHPYLDNFSLSVQPIQKEVYYLNSLGGFYQWAQRAVRVELDAYGRNLDGAKRTYNRVLWLADLSEENQKQIEDFVKSELSVIENYFHAIREKNAYLGPVILVNDSAAAQLIMQLFVANIELSKELLSLEGNTGGGPAAFVNKRNVRVLPDLIKIYDFPQMDSTEDGIPLGGFMPVDDEGVEAQNLVLAEDGFLVDFPHTSRPFDSQQESNGHARMTSWSFPRERLTNVYVEVKDSVSYEELKGQLLEKCRAQGLEYCYILEDFPDISNADADVNMAWRMYSENGYMEPVYGLRVSGVTGRTLRDIEAASDNSYLTQVTDGNFIWQTIYVPSLLLEELELVPSGEKLDKPPFVKKPAK